MQPTLGRLLTPERLGRLDALGWRLDAHFGNYARTMPATLAVKDMTALVIRTLVEGYGADAAQLEANSAWIVRQQCPPRSGPKQPLAGSINDSASMAPYALHSCAMVVSGNRPAQSVADLVDRYGARVTGEIQRLIVNRDDHFIHLVLNTKAGYVQCAPNAPPPSINCEAASADSIPTLAAVLNADRVARLHALGYADPDRVSNYAKAFPIAKAEASPIALELLTILYDVYGYRGTPKLGIWTERGR